MKKLLAQKRTGKAATAQLKITAVLIYYTVLGVMGLSTASVSFTGYAAETENIVQYLACENSGMSDCVFDSTFLSGAGTLAVVVIVLISFLPLVAILFSCDPRACKKKSQSITLMKKSSVLSAL